MYTCMWTMYNMTMDLMQFEGIVVLFCTKTLVDDKDYDGNDDGNNDNH